MTATNKQHGVPLDRKAIEMALRSLAIRLDENRAEPLELVVCGGSALILTGLITRTTQDVDVVALIRKASFAPLIPFLRIWSGLFKKSPRI